MLRKVAIVFFLMTIGANIGRVGERMFGPGGPGLISTLIGTIVLSVVTGVLVWWLEPKFERRRVLAASEARRRGAGR